eukprot:4907680-Amphidinium_carterae.3
MGEQQARFCCLDHQQPELELWPWHSQQTGLQTRTRQSRIRLSRAGWDELKMRTTAALISTWLTFEAAHKDVFASLETKYYTARIRFRVMDVEIDKCHKMDTIETENQCLSVCGNLHHC